MGSFLVPTHSCDPVPPSEAHRHPAHGSLRGSRALVLGMSHFPTCKNMNSLSSTCECTCVCVCAHARVYCGLMHMCEHMHVCVHTWGCELVCAHVYTCLCEFMCMYIYVHGAVSSCVHTVHGYMSLCACMCVHMCGQCVPCAHACTWLHELMCTHVYTCGLSSCMCMTACSSMKATHCRGIKNEGRKGSHHLPDTACLGQC